MRRRLILFLAVFGASLTLLAILLRGDEILRDAEKTTIGPTETGLGDGGLSVNSGTSQFVVEQLPERIELPVGEERQYVDDDGVTHTFSSGTLVLPDTDLFDEGLLSSNPVLQVFGSSPHQLVADVKAGQAAIYTYGPVEFENFASTDLPDVRRVFLTEGVEATLHGRPDEPGLLLKTSQMQMEIPPNWDGALGLPPVVCPQPIELRRSDDSLVLRGSSAELDPSRRSILIHPPVEVLAQVDGLGGQLGGWSEDPAEKGPLILQSEGDLEYTWTSPPGAEASTSDPDELRIAFGRGELTLRDRVRAQQGPRWLESEFLRVQIDRERLDLDAEDAELPRKERRSKLQYRYRFHTLEAYDHLGRQPVRFGLFGGSGEAGRLRLVETSGTLTLSEAVHFEGLEIGDGEQKLVLQYVEASEQITVTRSPDEAESLLTIQLEGSAAVQLDGPMVARGDSILLRLEQSPAGADGAEKWSPRRVRIRDGAELSFAGQGSFRGIATAAEIDLRPAEDGSRVLVMTGDAHCVIEGAADSPVSHADVRAPGLELQWGPEDPDSSATPPFELEVPELTEAEFHVRGLHVRELASSEDEDGGGADPAAGEEPLSVIRVEPAGTCSLTARHEAVQLKGRAGYRVLLEGREHQHVLCDQLDIDLRDPAAKSLLAQGSVTASFHEEGLAVTGDRVAVAQRIEAEGAPSRITVELTSADGAGDADPAWIEAAFLSFDPANGELEALARDGDPVRLGGAAETLRGVLPAADPAGASSTSPSAAAASESEAPGPPPPTLELTCRELFGRAAVGDERREEGSAGRLRHLRASHDVRVLRSDGLALSGEQLDIDVASQWLRLQGTPARLSRRKTGSDAVESARAEWMELRRNDDVIALTIAPSAVVQFQLTARQVGDPGARDNDPDAPRRVQIRTSKETRLVGALLQTEGGVETTVFLPEGRVLAASERLELAFDRSPLEGGQLLMAYARRDVSLDHPWFRCSGSLLAFDFENDWLELKSGLEPCRVVGDSAILPIAVDGLEATFHLLKCRLRSERTGGDGILPIDDLLIENLILHPRLAAASDR